AADAQVAAADTPLLLELIGDARDVGRGDGEPGPAAHARAVHAEHAPLAVDERPAGKARVQGRVGADVAAHLGAVHGAPAAADCADDAEGDHRPTAARPADREHQVVDLRFSAAGGDAEAGSRRLEDRDPGAGVPSGKRVLLLAAIG